MTTPQGEAVSTEAAPTPKDSLAARVNFSSGGKPWMIVLKPTPRGRKIDRFIVRWTGFSPMTFEFAKATGKAYHRPHLLLTTIGKRSGELRTSCLPFFRYEDKLVVCGTAGGGPKDPQWAWNIRANEHIWIRIKRKLIPATAYVATGEERARIFEVVATQHKGLERYQEQTTKNGRDVAMVVITPKAPIPA